MQRWTLTGLAVVLSATYLVWIYAHAIVDVDTSLRSMGLTLSSVVDDPDRQLMILLLVSFAAFIWTTMLYETGKYRESTVVPALGLGLILSLMATLLIRLSYTPLLHYVFAGLTFLFVVSLSIALAVHCKNRRLAFSVAAIIAVVFLPVILTRMTMPTSSVTSMRVMAGAELCSFLGMFILIGLYFQS